jgi:hypothetical protein
LVVIAPWEVEVEGLTRGPQAGFGDRVHIAKKVTDHIGEVVELGVKDEGWELLGDVIVVAHLDREAISLVGSREAIDCFIQSVDEPIYDVSVGHVWTVIKESFEIG